jgi:hypothetical protein
VTGGPTTARPVLAGSDLSAGADEALRQGARLATAVNAPFKVCHVLPELLWIALLFPRRR